MDRLALFQTIGLLTASNIFMNLAWYSHLGRLKASAWWVAVLASWGLAFFEYSLMVPANRIGVDGGLSVPQLKILQEALTLTVFVPVCLLVLKHPITLDFVWAALCLLGAVYFIFRSH
jgi:uncharacterized protein (DUF486 family)